MNSQRSAGAQYATGDQWRNNSRKNERMEPKQKHHPAVDVTGDRSKVWHVKSNTAYYAISGMLGLLGYWNIRSMNRGKLEVVKQEMMSEHRHFISKLNTKMQIGEFN